MTQIGFLHWPPTSTHASVTGTSHFDRPASRFLAESEAEALAKRVAAMAVGGGETVLYLESTWSGNLRFARNEITTTGDIRTNDVYVGRDIDGASAQVHCNHIDDVGLEAAIRRSERILRSREQGGDRRFREHFASVQPAEARTTSLSTGRKTREEEDDDDLSDATKLLVRVVEPYTKPKIFFDTTYNLLAADRVGEIEPLIASSRNANLRAAGYIQASAHGRAVMDTWGRSLYYPYTQAQFSVTVRDPKGTGSGWAGVDFSDWTRIDPKKLTEIAMDKCLRSRNPVAVEPGRYTAILEPQAVADIFSIVVTPPSLSRRGAEGGLGPFAAGNGNSKIGQQVLDHRITVSADPMDPDLGFPPFSRSGQVYHPVTWIENGVLKELAYDRSYGVETLAQDKGLPTNSAFRFHGGTTSVDEMVATTRRGLFVTRFYGVKLTPGGESHLTVTGYTRDGLWLIENGKISKAVKNFRILESPLFIFNNLEALGPAVRVFRPSAPIVAPSAKVRDFNFASLTDAI